MKLAIVVLVVVAASRPAAAAPVPDGGPGSTLFDWRSGGAPYEWLKQEESRLKAGDGCQLFSSWKDDGESYGSALHNIVLIALDPSEGESTYLVKNAVPDMDARLGVRYRGTGDERLSLDVALAFEGDHEAVFDELSRTEAATLRDRSWTRLELWKPLRQGKRLYMLLFACENGRSFMSTFRSKKRR